MGKEKYFCYIIQFIILRNDHKIKDDHQSQMQQLVMVFSQNNSFITKTYTCIVHVKNLTTLHTLSVLPPPFINQEKILILFELQWRQGIYYLHNATLNLITVRLTLELYLLLSVDPQSVLLLVIKKSLIFSLTIRLRLNQ